jgi:hypothetical protein
MFLLTQKKQVLFFAPIRGVIQKIENGKVRHPRIADSLARVLQVNPAWLQWGEPFAALWMEKSKALQPSATFAARICKKV